MDDTKKINKQGHRRDVNPGGPNELGRGRWRPCWTIWRKNNSVPIPSHLSPVISASPERAPLLHIPTRISHMTSRRAWPTSINTSKTSLNLSPSLRHKHKHKYNYKNPNRRNPSPSRSQRWRFPSLLHKAAPSLLTTANGLPILSSSRIQRIPFPAQDRRPRRLSRLSIQRPCRSRSHLQRQSRSLRLRPSFLCRQTQSRCLLPSSTSSFPHFPSAQRPSRKLETSPRSTSPSS